MKSAPQHSLLRRFFTSRLFFITIFCVVAVIAVGYARAYYQDYKVREEIEILQNEVQQLEKKKFQSMELLKYVTSDEFVEEKARTELNLKKPGENVVILPEVEVEERTISRTVEEPLQELSNPIKWWYYFIHKPLP